MSSSPHTQLPTVPPTPHQGDGRAEPIGRWGRLPSAAGEPTEELAWEETPTLRTRLKRALNLPTVIGLVVFGIAIVATAGIMLRGLSADSAPELHYKTAETVLDSATSLTGEKMPGASEQDAGAEAAGQTTGTIFVHVVGEVHTAGVYELPEGARVADALTAAGGATPLGRVDAINLARILGDGEQILVPDSEEAATLQLNAEQLIPDTPLQQVGEVAAVNLNTASSEQLQSLPGIGPALAGRILDWRDANGQFSRVEQLLEVSGIGEKTFEQFRNLVTV